MSGEVITKTTASVTAAFNEDKHLLEIMQSNIENDPHGMNYLEVTLGADGAGISADAEKNENVEDRGQYQAQNHGSFR